MMNVSVDVVIPAYRPGAEFETILERLEGQSVRPRHILVVNTEERFWKEEWNTRHPLVEVFHITKKEFDHAATRNMGAGFSGADYVLFMTQDAVPADDRLIRNLLRPFSDPLVKASYARQLPKADCRIPEGLVRSWNYPSKSEVRSIGDLEERGVKTFFCSNTCAMYERRTFQSLGGFTAPSIFNEDMIYTGRILNLGYYVAYAASAKVYHSHNYTKTQQFRRNFDNGVSQAMHPEIFSGVPSDREGRKLVRFVTSNLREMGRGYLIPSFYLECAARWLGFHLGKNYRHLPGKMVRSMSLNREFWDNAGENR